MIVSNEHILTHLLLVFLFALFFSAVQFLSKVLSPIIYPQFYLPKPASKKPWLDSPKIRALDWDIHVVSMVHSVMVAAIASWFFYSRSGDLKAVFDDRLFGYSFSVGVLMSCSCGYFLWDSFWSLRYIHVFGKGFALHAVVCFVNYFMALAPLVMYYGIVFLLWEWSTPFVNLHWFVSRLTKKENRARILSGLSVIVSFLVVRIVFGLYYSYQLQRKTLTLPWRGLYLCLCASTCVVFVLVAGDFILNYQRLPMLLLTFYTLSNVAINSLNLFWFSKMIKRLISPSKKGD